MSTNQKLLIRDAVATDIPYCQNLDNQYETDYVWQMNIFQDVGERRITLKEERLPRTLQTVYPIDVQRLQSSLPDEHCFIVAVNKATPEIMFGFLTMRHERFHNMAIISDIVVDAAYRRRKIGLRLLSIAQQWAVERQINQLMIETQTKNHPAILFCQRAGLTFCGFNDQYFENQDIAVFFGQNLRQR